MTKKLTWKDIPGGVEGDALIVMGRLRRELGREPEQAEFKAEVRAMGWPEAKLYELADILNAKAEAAGEG